MIPRLRARQYPHSLLFAGAFVLIAMIGGVNVATLADMRASARQSAEAALTGTANVVAEQADGAFRAVDVVIGSLADHFAREGASDAASIDAARRDAMHMLLKERLSGLPQVSAFTIVDARGRVVASSLDLKPETLDFTDRPYFQALKADSSLETTITGPVRSRVTGMPIIVMARRLPSSDGAFHGIVLGAVYQGYFEAYYGAVVSGGDLRVSLLREDGVALARYAEGDVGKARDGEAHAGTVGSFGPVRPGETAWAKGDDGVWRLFSARRLVDYPILTLVERPEASVFRDWIKTAWLSSLVSFCNVLLVIGLSVALARRWRVQTLFLRRLGESEALAREKSEQFEATLANLPQGLCMFDARERVVIANDRYSAIYDLPPGEMRPGTPLEAVIDMRLAHGVYAAELSRDDLLTDAEAGGRLHHLTNGRIVAVNRYAMPDGGFVAQHEDVTEAHRAMERVSFLARHDSLTRLVNRAQLIEHLTDFLHRLKRGQGCGVCVFLLDLDMFKAVNDNFGHGVGDELLREVGQRLRSAMRDVDVVARLGGDEFAILFMLDENGKADGARAVAERLILKIGAPYVIEEQRVSVGASIGIASAPEDGLDVDLLMSKADQALYKAKAAGRNGYRFYDATLESEARLRQSLHLDLSAAIEEEQFELHYQPIVAASGQEVVAAEALVRWRHPRDGLIGPDRFIGLAEETGLIAPLGDWILRRACLDARDWPAAVKVAVNISPAQFRNGGILKSVARVLEETKLPPERLDLEITENVFMKDSAETLEIFRGLKNLGVGISLDDFGAGYSSLGYIRAFPLDRIKIDRSFIAEALKSRDCAAIVATIVTLARHLDIATVAEGVETVEQQQFLRAAGCGFFQGYLFGRPTTAAALRERLARELKAKAS